MMRLIADLHIHSRYARACSPALAPERIELWSRIKGLDLIATGDFTHPRWFAELREKLEPAEPGLYRLKPEFQVTEPRFREAAARAVRFICGTELACIYRHNEQTRRVHHLVYFPSFEAVGRFNATLEERGAKLASDGRPILGMSSKVLLELVRSVDERGVLIPAHAWTPWFAVFGSKSGYDTLEECFEELTPEIFAIETGLSSDPPMNWRIPALDRVALVSSSDAHSLPNLGREATVFSGETLTYDTLMNAIRQGSPERRAKNGSGSLQLEGTLEFFPDEGRYHYDGHRAHGLRLSPAESAKQNGICPVCHQPLTIGVLNRVEHLATEPAGRRPDHAPTFTPLIELDKVIAQAIGVRGRTAKAVEEQYWPLVSKGGGELTVLSDTSIDKLASITEPEIVEAIKRLRAGNVTVEPGYDGEYGRVTLITDRERKRLQQGKLL